MMFSRYLRYSALRLSRGKRYLRRLAAGRMARAEYAFFFYDLRWMARRAIDALGRPGMTAIGFLVACSAFYFSSIEQAQERLADAHQNYLNQQEQLRHGGKGANASQHRPEERVAQFYQLFPQDKELPQYMQKVFTSAQRYGIDLEKGEYKVKRDKSGGLVRFQMTFPVTGDYPRIRKYLAGLMADIPTLALQQVQFKRQTVGDPTVAANIKLVLYLLEAQS